MSNGLSSIILLFDFHNINHVCHFYDIKHHYEARGEGGKLFCGKINQFERENIVYHSLTLHVYLQHFELNDIYMQKISHKMSFQNVNDVYNNNRAESFWFSFFLFWIMSLVETFFMNILQKYLKGGIYEPIIVKTKVFLARICFFKIRCSNSRFLGNNLWLIWLFQF